MFDWNVKDLRKCSKEELTDQEISSRIALACDCWRDLQQELLEVEKVIKGLREEQYHRTMQSIEKQRALLDKFVKP